MSHLSFSDGNVTSQAALKVEASCKTFVNMNGLELVDKFLSHFACCKGGLVERASLPSWISYLWGPSKPGQGSGKHTALSSMICSSICRMWKTVWAWQTCECTVAALWSEPFHKKSQESLLFHSEVLRSWECHIPNNAWGCNAPVDCSTICSDASRGMKLVKLEAWTPLSLPPSSFLVSFFLVFLDVSHIFRWVFDGCFADSGVRLASKLCRAVGTTLLTPVSLNSSSGREKISARRFRKLHVIQSTNQHCFSSLQQIMRYCTSMLQMVQLSSLVWLAACGSVSWRMRLLGRWELAFWTHSLVCLIAVLVVQLETSLRAPWQEMAATCFTMAVWWLHDGMLNTSH